MKRRLAQLEGYIAQGDVFSVDWAVAEGRFPTLINEAGWPVPAGFRFGRAPECVVITDELGDFTPNTAYLRPPSLIAGIHPSPHAEPDDIERILITALADAGLARSSVFTVATADHTRNDRSVRRLGYAVRSFQPHELNRIHVPNPSSSLRKVIGAQSVCEASALLAAGPGAQLLIQRTRTTAGTIAIARRKPTSIPSSVQDLVIDFTAPATSAHSR